MLALSIVPLFYICLLLPALARNSRRDGKISRRQEVMQRRDALDVQLPRDALQPAPLEKRDGTKYVFMHHVRSEYPYVYNDWLNDVKQISAMGVDAVALNIGSDVWQWDRVVDAYNAAAASGTGLKMFISFDYTSFVCDNGYATTNWTNYFANYSAQFKVDGKTFISTYGGGYDCLGVANWKTVKANTNGYLMPFFWDSENTFKTDWAFLDSWYCWGCAWPQGDWDKNVDIQQLGAGRYATTVSGWFFTHLTSKNFYLRGDDWLLPNRWDQLFQLRDQLTFVEMVTWNDYGESDYFGPFEGAQPAGTYWAQNYPHTAWINLSKYYITAYKTGTYPTITQDVVYWWCRPHPALATATSDSLGRPTGYDWADDYLWAVAFCSSTCTVTLTLGTSTQTFSNLAYGVNKLKLPMAVGTVGIKMVKSSTTVINASPTGFSVIATPSQYNYNVFVGAETASIAVTGTSTASSSTTTKTSSSATSTVASTSTTKTSTSTSTSATATSTFTSVGCIAEGTTGTRRALTAANFTSSSMTPAKCQAFCSSYTYAGTEYSSTGYCGNSITNNGATGTVVSSSNCNYKCGGDSSQTCGGSYFLNLYAKAGTTVSSSTSSTTSTTTKASTTTTTTKTSTTSSTSSTTKTSTSSTSSASSTANTSSFSYVGCVAEGTTGTRYCGNTLTNNGATGTVVSSSNCNYKCAGDSSQYCGGSYYLSLYSKASSNDVISTSSSSTASSTSTSSTASSTSTSSTASSTSTSTSFTAVGCIAEGTTGTRYALTGASYREASMTTERCQSLCAGFCGNTVTNNGATGTVVDSSNCNYKCAGNSAETCGGNWYLNLYKQ
ncbi:glycosyl hydrolase family 71-domain-containing protein [Lentinula raphanica]|nr:glycosyl hydrolase family 71-domain-containing protein [Lentinula raphanica]